MRTSDNDKSTEVSKPIGNRKLAIGNVKWSGREADAPLRTPRSPTVTVLPGKRSKKEKVKGKKKRKAKRPLILFPFSFCLFYLIAWCPRKDSNLQPLVCRTSAAIS